MYRLDSAVKCACRVFISKRAQPPETGVVAGVEAVKFAVHQDLALRGVGERRIEKSRNRRNWE